MTVLTHRRERTLAWEVGYQPIPGYRVLEHMRRGRDLDVYDVWSSERRCRCVLKTTRPDRAASSAADRLRLEGSLLLACTHPSLVRAYDLHETTHGPIVVLEALPGATLGVLLGKHGRLDAGDLGHLGVHLTSALYYLHGRGYLHLDVKPGNIVAHRGRATLIDMSLARPPGPSSGGRGTPGYMSPEQIQGGPLEAATDVWGIGAVLYEAATGSPVVDPDDLESSSSTSTPGSGSDGPDSDGPDSNGVTSDGIAADSVATNPLPARPPRVRARRRLPADIAAVIDACLEHDPARRPTIEVLAEAMATLSGEPPDGVYQD